MIFLLWITPYVLTIYSVEGIIKYFHFIEIVPPLCLTAGMLIMAICNGLSRILRWSARVLPYFIITGIGLFGLTSTALLVDVDVNKSFFEMSAFVSNRLSQAGNNKKKMRTPPLWDSIG